MELQCRCRSRPSLGLTGSRPAAPTAAATSPAAAAAIAAATSAAAATTSASLGPGLIDRQSPSLDRATVQHGDGLLPLQFGFHFHKAEAPRLAGLPVGDDFRRSHIAGLGKEVF